MIIQIIIQKGDEKGIKQKQCLSLSGIKCAYRAQRLDI